MEFRQLRYFLEIIKAQNYSHAAKNLFVTQPTLSWNMNKLQEELGAKLLYQVGNKVMPTTAGTILFEQGQKIINDLDDLTEQIETDHIYEKKELTIGSNAVISPVFMPLIQQFMSIYPNFSITIEEDGSVKTQQKVANGELEIGIVSFPITEGNLEIERNIFEVFKYDAYVLMREDHPLSNSKELSIKELKNETFSSMSKDYVLWHVLKNKAREYGFSPKINLMSNNHEVLVNSILKDNSIALLPIQLKEIYKSAPLTWIPLKDKIKPFDIVVVHKKDQPLSPAAALCLEFITNQKKIIID
ncbi:MULTISPECIES: LysR family transcriptional regulator [Vagococcus]|uniref:Transcriptional regulator, LysR family n=1 Tax=Vagococcus fluvialis bH819 TaxID=1255619 RepID=A0A1X6WN00_9ENTE|nr:MULTISPECIES: LysR family transcriptional regulator [Vagococcus]SLM85694.1 Transcriptional regulator, LysR family [Vagococcus fluvialis bH819]HCM90116.1 LysR family transcriptional regulator [Vagococcus sp.]